jgi:multisubunit Na+/H+ antiporter MnhB subunit
MLVLVLQSVVAEVAANVFTPGGGLVNVIVLATRVTYHHLSWDSVTSRSESCLQHLPEPFNLLLLLLLLLLFGTMGCCAAAAATLSMRL